MQLKDLTIVEANRGIKLDNNTHLNIKNIHLKQCKIGFEQDIDSIAKDVSSLSVEKGTSEGVIALYELSLDSEMTYNGAKYQGKMELARLQ